jgi:hypothetical protein
MSGRCSRRTSIPSYTRHSAEQLDQLESFLSLDLWSSQTLPDLPFRVSGSYTKPSRPVPNRSVLSDIQKLAKEVVRFLGDLWYV